MKLFSTWTLFFLVCFGSFAQLQKVPKLEAYVTDHTGTLSTGDITRITDDLEKLEEEKGSQVVVLIVPTTAPETIEQYSWRVAEGNKIGRNSTNDGVLLLVAKEDRKVRIEVGYGLEGAIPDAIAKRIIEEQIIPNFKADDFYAGIEAGVAAIATRIRGEELPPPVEKSGMSGKAQFIKGINVALTDFQFTIIYFSFIPLIILIELMKHKFGKWKGFALGAVLGYVILLILIPFFYASFIQGIVVIMSFLGTLLGGGGGGTGSGGGRYYGGYVGGYGGGGFGGGGGFSGGGGSFGGGGASGGW